MQLTCDMRTLHNARRQIVPDCTSQFTTGFSRTLDAVYLHVEHGRPGAGPVREDRAQVRTPARKLNQQKEFQHHSCWSTRTDRKVYTCHAMCAVHDACRLPSTTHSRLCMHAALHAATFESCVGRSHTNKQTLLGSRCGCSCGHFMWMPA